MINKLPSEYLKNMQELLENKYQDYLSSFDDERVYGLRVNTLKISVADFIKISPFKLEKIPFTTDGFYYQKDDKPAKHPYYYAGLYYLQEPSAMLPAEVLEINNGDVVLDGCAAPGGKSTKLASKLNDTGIIIANDISASRCQGLVKNIELAGIKNCHVICEDLINIQDKLKNSFDKILIDAPCSGEGMFRKDSTLIKNWIDKGNEYYSKIQKEIIVAAIKMLKEGGQLVYSTCTFSPIENEDVISYALKKYPELKVLKPEVQYEGFNEGIDSNLKDCIRLYPFNIKGEGHFVCLLQKGKKQVSQKEVKYDRCYVPESLRDFFDLVDFDLTKGYFKTINEKIYFIYHHDLDLNKVRTIRSGLLVGVIKKNRFEPSTTFALALKKEQFKQVIDLKADDIRVIKYLKRETLEVKDYDCQGYVLICVDGYPLGFGKVSKGILKNMYEVGFRWQ
ncbi:MAG: RsmB/NOP family class I SAM-dependent RNA methyltransferase [Bacillota bacterium]|jgi:NOL1/NOP2/sun family putative RNA methylase|nr:RsmB/NOP family class I SAM-dependent RNA methyltransferase [Bacillota bacterium]NLL26372.1 NOL1/NOP2/sun family putative RNA methylase [Erysipelotrichia bacterium]